MELRHLRYCVAIADEESFSRASIRLRIAQPALSRQIKAIEEEIGVTLFQRLPRGVALSDAGRVFIDEARAVLATVEAAVQKARRAQRGEVGLLRIGFTGSASFNPFVTRAIRDFRKLNPHVEIELVEEATASLLARFSANRLDVAFLRPAPGEVDHLWSMHVLDEPLVVAMPSEHPQAARKRVDLRALAREDFIIYPRQNGRALFDLIISVCRDVGFSPKVLQIAPQLTSIVNLVATGIGLSIVPASIAQVTTPGVVYRPFRGAVARAELTLVRSPAKELRPALLFTELVKSLVAANKGSA
ncbi:MAG: LysR family transcriptional regulator [Rhodoblastus sp.]|nr:LysR family transcriptional regulator [Rhodoblastus sp.]